MTITDLQRSAPGLAEMTPREFVVPQPLTEQLSLCTPRQAGADRGYLWELPATGSALNRSCLRRSFASPHRVGVAGVEWGSRHSLTAEAHKQVCHCTVETTRL